jgi:hypothetical protein
MTADLKRSPVVIPELGPLKIGHDDWQMLVRQTKAFCGKNPSLDFCTSDVCFIIVKEGQRNRILLLPFSNREIVEIPAWVKPFSKIMVAFGYVKGITTSFGNPDEETKESSSTKPVSSDVKLSVELDNIVGRPLYYVIMNRNFEYEVYKTPMENLFGILTPVTEESSKPEQVSVQETESSYAFECRDCGLRFKSIGEGKRHTESNKGHKIFRLERND